MQTPRFHWLLLQVDLPGGIKVTKEEIYFQNLNISRTKFDAIQLPSAVEQMTFSWLCWIWHRLGPCVKPSHRDAAVNRKGTRELVLYDLAHVQVGIKQDYNGEGTVPLPLSKEINASVHSAAPHEELVGQAFLIHRGPFVCLHVQSKSSPADGVQSTVQ